MARLSVAVSNQRGKRAGTVADRTIPVSKHPRGALARRAVRRRRRAAGSRRRGGSFSPSFCDRVVPAGRRRRPRTPEGVKSGMAKAWAAARTPTSGRRRPPDGTPSPSSPSSGSRSPTRPAAYGPERGTVARTLPAAVGRATPAFGAAVKAGRCIGVRTVCSSICRPPTMFRAARNGARVSITPLGNRDPSTASTGVE